MEVGNLFMNWQGQLCVTVTSSQSAEMLLYISHIYLIPDWQQYYNQNSLWLPRDHARLATSRNRSRMTSYPQF